MRGAEMKGEKGERKIKSRKQRKHRSKRRNKERKGKKTEKEKQRSKRRNRKKKGSEKATVCPGRCVQTGVYPAGGCENRCGNKTTNKKSVREREVKKGEKRKQVDKEKRLGR